MKNMTVTSKLPYSVFIICCLGLFISTLDTGIINLALHSLSDSFHVPLDYIGFTVTLYLLFLIIFLIPAGWFGDLFGQKTALFIGFFLFGLTSMTAGLANTANQLILSRCGQGLGAALLQANCFGLAGLQSTQHKQMLNTAIMLAISLGPILGPSLGGLIITMLGWPLLFFINIPLCILGCFFSTKLATYHRLSNHKQLDFIGAILFILISVNCIIIIYRNKINISSFYFFLVLIVTLIIIILFWKIEFKIARPFFPAMLCLNSVIKYILFSSAFFGFTAGIIFSASPILLLDNTEHSLFYIGLVCTMPSIGVVLSVFIRKLLHKHHNNLIIYYALSLIILSFILLLSDSLTISVSNYMIATLCFGIGGGLLQSSLIHIAMNQHKEKQSTIGGLLRLFQNVGIIIGSSFALARLGTDNQISIFLFRVNRLQQLWSVVLGLSIIMLIYSYNLFKKNSVI